MGAATRRHRAQKRLEEYEVACSQCGKKFRAKKPRAGVNYCGPTCRNQASYARRVAREGKGDKLFPGEKAS
jgi:hypothetical protein